MVADAKQHHTENIFTQLRSIPHSHEQQEALTCELAVPSNSTIVATQCDDNNIKIVEPVLVNRCLVFIDAEFSLTIQWHSLWTGQTIIQKWSSFYCIFILFLSNSLFVQIILVLLVFVKFFVFIKQFLYTELILLFCQILWKLTTTDNPRAWGNGLPACRTS